jgi:hypothetical protein
MSAQIFGSFRIASPGARLVSRLRNRFPISQALTAPYPGVCVPSCTPCRPVKYRYQPGFEGTFALEYEDGEWDGVECVNTCTRECWWRCRF